MVSVVPMRRRLRRWEPDLSAKLAPPLETAVPENLAEKEISEMPPAGAEAKELGASKVTANAGPASRPRLNFRDVTIAVPAIPPCSFELRAVLPILGARAPGEITCMLQLSTVKGPSLSVDCASTDTGIMASALNTAAVSTSVARLLFPA